MGVSIKGNFMEEKKRMIFIVICIFQTDLGFEQFDADVFTPVEEIPFYR